MLTKVCLDGEEHLFNRVEVRGIRGKKDESAHGLVLNQSPNLFSMMDTAVVEYKHALGPRVTVSQGNDKLSKKLKESICID
jgi:hypothetical protein